MPLIKRSTPEEKEAQAREKRLKQRQQAIEKLRSDFFASPAGQARLAFERGDAVLQYSLDVHQTQAIVVPMIGACRF